MLRYARQAHRRNYQLEQQLALQRTQHDEEDRKQWAERNRKLQLLGQALTLSQR